MGKVESLFSTPLLDIKRSHMEEGFALYEKVHEAVDAWLEDMTDEDDCLPGTIDLSTMFATGLIATYMGSLAASLIQLREEAEEAG